MNQNAVVLLFLAYLSSISANLGFAIPVEPSSAPENNLALTVRAIRSAKQSIALNIYELSSSDIADAILSQIQAGVSISLLEEGSPVGGMSSAAKGIESQLIQAMNGRTGDHFFLMSSQAGTKRRFRFDHAKYAVIDHAQVLIGSENYSPTGNPVPGSLGNRGWEVLIDDPKLAQEYQSTFDADTSVQFGDVTELTKSSTGKLKSVSAEPKAKLKNSLEAVTVTPITSPDTSLSGLLSLINNAHSTIDIEQMTFDSAWNKQAGASPLTQALKQAAKRGVKVRVLLNDEHVFDHPGHPAAPHNSDTVALMNGIPNIQAIIANLKRMGVDYIHNKGVLVDGQLTLISSINWDQNSIQNNREAAVLIQGKSVNDYYQNLFNQDWAASQGPKLESYERLTAESADSCPHEVHLNVKINSIKNADAEDSDFQSLSGETFDRNLVRDNLLHGCTFVQTNESAIGQKLTLEIKLKGQEIGFSIEGYTPIHGKLFSIRGYTQTIDSRTRFQGRVYDGSAIGREVLGNADVELDAD